MTVLLGPTPCHTCKRPVTIVRRPSAVPCVWCDFHKTASCQCATAHAHMVPDSEWAVEGADGASHRCAESVTAA